MDLFDATIVGGGIIGCAIACELSRRNLRVLVLDRQEPGREASWAAAGMLSPSPDPADSPELLPLAKASYELYPDFISWIEDLSGLATSYRRDGAFHLFPDRSGEEERDEFIAQHGRFETHAEPISIDDAIRLEPLLGPELNAAAWLPAEASIDPRALLNSAFGAARNLGVEFRAGATVTSVRLIRGRCEGVNLKDLAILSGVTIVAAGCFSSQIESVANYAPTCPVRGQMMALRPTVSPKHVLRTNRGYLVPRPDGRVVAGSTIEHAGYQKCVTPAGLMKILGAATEIIPSLAHAEIVETWSGLRPGTPDDLPSIGPTDKEDLLIAAGHYRNGILLAPATAKLIGAFVSGEMVPADWSRFSPLRFAQQSKAAEVEN